MEQSTIGSYVEHIDGIQTPKDGMKAAGALRSVISKGSNIASRVCKSTVSTELLEGHHKLQAASVTRST